MKEEYILSVQRIAALLFITVVAIYVCIIGKQIISPLLFAILFALMLKPITGFFERRLRSRIVSIILTFSVIVVPVVGMAYLVCWQSYGIYSTMPSIAGKVEKGLDDTFRWMDQKFNLRRGKSEQIVMDSFDMSEKEDDTARSKTGAVLGEGMRISSAFLGGIFIALIYTFLLLLYRTAIKKFFLFQFGYTIRENAERYLYDIQRVVQQYLYGVFIVMLILGTLNSIGLWVIGIQHALFFGFLAAGLAIIPYVGTFVGGALPLAFTVATTDEVWKPVAVAFLFILVQAIEGNFISPKVAGNTVQLNPMASIFILLAGGAIWGVAGMVLALPMLAIFRTTCRYIPFLSPVSLLLSSELYEKDTMFEEKYDDEKHRLWSFFKEKKH